MAEAKAIPVTAPAIELLLTAGEASVLYTILEERIGGTGRSRTVLEGIRKALDDAGVETSKVRVTCENNTLMMID